MSYNNGPRIITDGLFCYLDPANVKSYIGGNDTKLYDLIGNNHATIYNRPAFNNNFFTLSSTNDYIEISHILQPVTIDFWFNTPNTNSGPIICAGVDIYNSSSWQWSFFYVNNVLYWRPNAGSGGANITSFVSINNWYHFVMIRGSSGSSTVYLNGVNISTFGASKIDVTGFTRIGKGGLYWNGSFGPLKMYDKILTPDEIQQNYNALKGRFGLS
jgi:hypothetical protein